MKTSGGNEGTFSKLSLKLLFTLAAISLVGCSQGGSNGDSKVNVEPPAAVSGDPDLVAVVGPYKTYGRQKLEELVGNGEFYARDSKEFKAYIKKLPAKVQRSAALSDVAPTNKALPDPEKVKGSLILAFPVKFLGEQNVFGGVVTKVSDQTDEQMGMLKLMELSPLHVRPLVTGVDTAEPQLSLFGCAENCSERAESQNQLNIPVLGVDPVSGNLLVDLSALGQKLNLISIFDPNGQETQLKPKTSYTSLLDYSAATLVFDVESDMIPVASDITDPSAPITKFTFRWYLKPTSGFDPAFEVRDPVQEVGFFTTERGAKKRITRWGMTATAEDTIHYFVKNVPDEHKEAFRLALEDWNKKLSPVMGRNVISYEFIDPQDEKGAYVIAGDVRFNVIEWDLNNVAPYGGFGPSIANQHTGEIFAANTLIQGPTVIKIYKKWFNVSGEVNSLRARGQIAAANEVLLNFHRETADVGRIGKAQVKMGQLNLKVGATLPELRDPVMQRGEFDVTPEGETFESYIKGYFIEMVAHEVGHNLGLRHNFRGNLGDDNSKTEGSSSRSVMEYLGRNYRHINRISPYDVMAMSYGYLGVKPTESQWFCTDEHVINPRNVLLASAECSRDDATSDPFGYYSGRMTQAVNYLVNRGSTQAPVWGVMDMQRELTQAMMGMAYYGASAKNSDKWTNFVRDGRPSDPQEIRTYVLNSLKAHLCDPGLIQEIEKKETPEAKQKTIENVATLRMAAARTLSYYGLYAKEEVECK